MIATRHGQWRRVLRAVAPSTAVLALGLTALAPSAISAAGLRPLNVVLDTTAGSSSLAQAIAMQLNEFGLHVSIRQWQFTDLLTQEQAGTRQMYMSDWGSAYFDPYDLAAPKLMTNARGNRSFFSNKTFDFLMTQASTTNDTALRKGDYIKAQQILYRQVPWVFGYYLDNVQVASARLKGWQPYEDGMEPMAKVAVTGSPTVTVALPTNAILTLDPTASYSDRSTEEVIQNVFDSLVTLSPGRTILPQLATHWAVSQAGLTYTFTLRHGVRFQNGQPFTSQDVVFTADRLLGLGPFQGHPSTRAALIDPPNDALTVSAKGPYTVVFHFQQPFPLFLYGLVHMEIVPHLYYQAVGPAKFALHPIGTGPFRYQSGSYSGPIVLARNVHYWGGAPKITKLVFLPEPEPESTVAGLLSGSIDLGTHLPFDQLSQFEDNPQFQVKEVPGTRAYFIELNNKLPPFNNLDVRLAFNYAIDWNTILAAIYGTHAHRMATAFLPSGFGYDPALKPYPYDPAKAVELLHAAGYAAHLP